MDVRFVHPELRSLDAAQAEVLACPVWEDQRPLRGTAGLLDFRLAGRLSRLLRQGFLRGQLGEVLLFPGRPRLPFDKVLVLGLGARTAFGEGTFRSVLSRLMHALEGLRVRRAVLELPGRADGLVEPQRAYELLADSVGESEYGDAFWLVEPPEGERLIAERAQDERRRSRRE